MCVCGDHMSRCVATHVHLYWTHLYMSHCRGFNSSCHSQRSKYSCSTRRHTGGIWMQQRNFFNALAGLKLDDSPSSSPTAAAAANKPGAGTTGAMTSRDQAEALKGGLQQQHTQQAGQQTEQQQQQQPSQQGANTSAERQPGPSKKLPGALVWIDLEMTGLDPEKDTILEIACLVTDGDLAKVVEGPNIAIHHSEAVLANMNQWCQDHHHKSGLVKRVQESRVSLQQAEDEVLAFVKEYTEYKQAQLAGNSVHVDRVFLQKLMPQLLDHLHYRIVDVSTLQELCRRWQPRMHRKAPRKVAAHTALSDIKESLKELQYYKRALFKVTN